MAATSGRSDGNGSSSSSSSAASVAAAAGELGVEVTGETGVKEIGEVGVEVAGGSGVVKLVSNIGDGRRRAKGDGVGVGKRDGGVGDSGGDGDPVKDTCCHCSNGVPPQPPPLLPPSSVLLLLIILGTALTALTLPQEEDTATALNKVDWPP